MKATVVEQKGGQGAEGSLGWSEGEVGESLTEQRWEGQELAWGGRW